MKIYIASTFRTDEQRLNVLRAAQIINSIPQGSLGLSEDGISIRCEEKISAVVPMEFKVPRAWEIPNKEWADIVMRHDIDSISACDAVVLLYYGDHGATQPGTCFECGYAFAKGIPVIGVAMTREPVSLMLGSAFRAMLDGLKGLESYDFRKMPKTNPIRELI
jgi:nucleoside 2-deoxyribosyltransferase